MKSNSGYLMSDQGLSLLSKLFHSSGEGIMFFNQKGEIEALNPRAEQIFGYKEPELAGKKVEMLIPSGARKDHTTYRATYLKNPTPRPMGVGMDLSGLKKDGTTFPLEISLSYINHEDEVKVVAFITDISIRKEQERTLDEQRKKLEEYTSQLEEKVKDRTRELEQMNMGLQSQIQERKLAEEALKKSLEDVKKAEQEILKSLEKEKELSELKSRFVSMASHEFRTPLTTISSSANLIGRYTETAQQESRMKHITRINNSVKNLTGILNDFLSLEKVETGALKVSKTTFLFSGLISEVIEEMTPTLKRGQDIRMKNEVVQNDLFTDPHILKNILINLLSNASKYSEEDKKIGLEAVSMEHAVRITITDKGIGIPLVEQKNLFERFFRAANAVNIQGTGLGLNIVKKYIDLLDGTITFESKEEKGSRFTIEIPVVDRL